MDDWAEAGVDGGCDTVLQPHAAARGKVPVHHFRPCTHLVGAPYRHLP